MLLNIVSNSVSKSASGDDQTLSKPYNPLNGDQSIKENLQQAMATSPNQCAGNSTRSRIE
ncbi:hypothetical protein PGT21_027414 [Puccinia graminis f. sp. tritici]|uniref:Uncharacterized protein n=1 Tax=Puccinia graminis f. sp. tritici TaxID=56615 RepID=A0A5B0PJB0_PUCGR|nr:hypothetical protein PGT21_027414 [Puccinia graminis f. sp. tritici]